MLVSVIIPTYNRADLIKETIESFMQQSCMKFELIIVDDGSTDNTKEVVESFRSDIIRYFYRPNAERGASRNFGADNASGKFLNFFDSDDLALPNHISTAIDTIELNSQINVFQLHVANRFGDKVEQITPPRVSTINIAILNGEYCYPNGLFIERNVFQAYRYNETRALSGTEDWELYLRMIPNEVFYFFPMVTSVYVNHSERSVLQFNEPKMLDRLNELMKGIKSSEPFRKKFPGKEKLVESRMLSYISLHAALDGKKSIAITFLKMSLKLRPLELFTRRAFAIIRRLF